MKPSAGKTTLKPSAASRLRHDRVEPWHDLVISGHLTLGDTLIAGRICRLVEEPVESAAALALVLAIRAVREGSTALDVHTAADLLAEQGDEGAASAEPTSLSADDDQEEPDQEAGPGGSEAISASNTTNTASEPGAEQRLSDLVELLPPQEWLGAVTRSSLAASGVLHVDLDLVYLDRYFCDETSITERLLARESTAPANLPLTATQDAAGIVGLNEAQQAAVTSVLTRATTVLTGGPGMGKTHTIGGVITAVRAAAGPDVRIALAAPTGKAAARMGESLTEQGIELDEPATTLHRLLGPRFGTSQRFRHDRRSPLPHDLVVVDEASMISLSMMARLLEALPDTTRLLLVGDPDQLASVEAGSVLRDVADGLGPERGVVRLTEEFRLATRRAELARAFRHGDAEAVLTILDTAATPAHRGDEGGEHEMVFVELSDGADNAADRPEAEPAAVATGKTAEPVPPDLTQVPAVVRHAERLRELALAGDRHDAVAALGTARLLCAHRTGPYGTRRWNRLVEQALAERWPEISHQEMYVGRPVLVTRNDYGAGLTNGDTGIVLRHDDELVTAFTNDVGTRQDLSPWRLADVETMHAMTVHKAQGSQAEHVTVIVPPVGSRLLTREMLYTAVTRARRTLTIVGTRDAIRTAVLSPARRSSGLGRRLREGHGGSEGTTFDGGPDS